MVGENPAMKEEFSFQFRTPTVRVKASSPPDSIRDQMKRLPLCPVIHMEFDQLIDPEKMVGCVNFFVGENIDWRKEPVPYASARLFDIDSVDIRKMDSTMSQLIKNPLSEGRSMPFLSTKTLPHGETIQVVLRDVRCLALHFLDCWKEYVHSHQYSN